MPRYAYFNSHDGRVLQWIDTDAMSYVLPDASLLHECTGAEWDARHSGEKMIQNGVVIDYVEPVAPEPTIEQIRAQMRCNSYQLRQALSQAGLRDQVEAAVASGGQELMDAWFHWPTFDRLHPKILQIGTALGQTDAQLDDLFNLAATLQP